MSTLFLVPLRNAVFSFDTRKSIKWISSGLIYCHQKFWWILNRNWRFGINLRRHRFNSRNNFIEISKKLFKKLASERWSMKITLIKTHWESIPCILFSPFTWRCTVDFSEIKQKNFIGFFLKMWRWLLENWVFCFHKQMYVCS